MIVAIHQPQYLPWLGYFHKMLESDAFCYLDNVQFRKNEWQNRNRIKNARGWQWITVPVRQRFPQTIEAVEINNTVNWRKKHLQALISNYGRASHFSEHIGFFEDLYSQDWARLSELNIQVIEHIRDLLGMSHKPAVRASKMELSTDPTGRLIDICKAMNADTYLSGQGGTGYLDTGRFHEAGLRVEFQTFDHPAYSQVFGPFQSHMSIVDLLFNCGREEMRRILEKQKSQ